MVFSSPVFLFIFFPIFYSLYFAIPNSFRNSFILILSFMFYFVGAGALTLVALLLLLINWSGAILICNEKFKRTGNDKSKKLYWIFLTINLLPLIFFKYLLFITQIATDLTGFSLESTVKNWNLLLPLGISFYTFHFISYLTDVFRGNIKPEPSLRNFSIYIFLFPHLIAGPVVRFSEVKEQLDIKKRRIVKTDVFWGLVIFSIGLSKKVLIADPLGSVVDVVHRPDFIITTYSAWLSAFCYSFQIYFDFSGYTDMAIGMARIMGFRFPRNFNRPYASRSITDFWQRWHMTLSRWFRDYLYIPLGGNRTTTTKTYRNLFVVFLLCALWHGAAYTFLIWGIGHGTLIALERAELLKMRNWRAASLPVFFCATLLWVPFRADNVSQTSLMIRAMSGLDNKIPIWSEANKALADPKIIFLISLSLLICLIGDKFFSKITRKIFRMPFFTAFYSLIIYIISCISVVERGFNPFIYFQF